MKAVRHLAEAIILQSIEDLWDEEHREECTKFFTGEDFRTCAALAGLDTADQIKILNMFSGLMKARTEKGKDSRVYKYESAGSQLRRELVSSGQEGPKFS